MVDSECSQLQYSKTRRSSALLVLEDGDSVVVGRLQGFHERWLCLHAGMLLKEVASAPAGSLLTILLASDLGLESLRNLACFTAYGAIMLD